MNTKVNKVLIHIVASALFMSLPVLFAPGPLSINSLSHPRTHQEIISYGLILIVFYINYYYLVPRLFFNKKHLKYIGSLLFFLVLVLLIPRVLIGPAHFHGLPRSMPHMPPPRGWINMFEYIMNVFPFLLMIFFSLMIRINDRLKQTEKEKTMATLSYLKAQINPHFLFNTLNSIYSLAIEKSDYTATAIVKLSGMMRYVISETNSDFVSLDKEITYITDYIDLQKVRLGNTINLSFSIKGSYAGKQIAPFILIPFVENAFKHGVNPEENSSIVISIEIKENEIILIVNNNKVNINKSKEIESGLGIRNTRNRLQLLYPANHSLIINDDNKEFKVYLQISI